MSANHVFHDGALLRWLDKTDPFREVYRPGGTWDQYDGDVRDWYEGTIVDDDELDEYKQRVDGGDGGGGSAVESGGVGPSGFPATSNHNPQNSRLDVGSHGQAHGRTIAVDLDGTLTEPADFNPYTIPPPKSGAREALERLRAEGFEIIIWTVRGNTEQIAEWLREHRLPFDHINANPAQPPGGSDKVIAHVYWDDRAVNATGDLLDSVNHVILKAYAAESAVSVQQHRDKLDAGLRKARQTTDPMPTERQKETGRYRKGRVKIQGLTIEIENPKGSIRTGTAPDGTQWSSMMHADYGGIVRVT